MGVMSHLTLISLFWVSERPEKRNDYLSVTRAKACYSKSYEVDFLLHNVPLELASTAMTKCNKSIFC